MMLWAMAKLPQLRITIGGTTRAAGNNGSAQQHVQAQAQAHAPRGQGRGQGQGQGQAGPLVPGLHVAAEVPADQQQRTWDALAGATLHLLHALSPSQVANAMWALASSPHYHCAVVVALARAVAPHVASLTQPRDLANIVWALAKRQEGWDQAQLLHAAEQTTLRLLPLLQPQHVACLLWGFATLKHKSAGGTLYRALAARAMAGAGARHDDGRLLGGVADGAGASGGGGDHTEATGRRAGMPLLRLDAWHMAQVGQAAG